MTHKGIAIFTFLAFCIHNSIAQTLTVLDIETNYPISDVKMRNQDSSVNKVTNQKGQLELSDVPKNDTLYFNHLNYLPEHFAFQKLKQSNFKIYLTPSEHESDITVISVSREQMRLNDPQMQIQTLNPEDLPSIQAQTAADMLDNNGSVYVQRSQMGGGSPVIRGFEANKILLVVDGIRLNNAIYRNGHLQNIITIDHLATEKAEVIFGPSSVQYGSDALGGVVHFHTKEPILATNEKFKVATNALVRYASANNEKTTHLDFSAGGRKFGVMSSITLSDFGDLRAGSIRNPDYPDFGKRRFYVEQIDGQDTMIANHDLDVQKFTGYKQGNFVQKALFRPNKNLDFTLNFQYSTSSDIPRYDQLTAYDDDELKYAEWFYGPQKRLLTAFKTRYQKSNTFFDGVVAIIAYQKIDEDRITRRYQASERLHQEEDVHVYSTVVDFSKEFSKRNNSAYGFEWHYNIVESNAFEEDTETQFSTPAITRYPDGGSIMQTLAAYLVHKTQLSNNLRVSAGTRYNYVTLYSEFVDRSLMTLPFSEVTINKGALTGNINALYETKNGWQLNTIASTGFRTPNVDDYGKIRVKSQRVLIPNNRLKPEYAYNGEFTLSKMIGEKTKISGTCFYTYLVDAIIRQNYVLNDQDSILYQGEMHRIQTNINAGKADIRGASLNLSAKLSKNFMFKSSVSYILGRDLTNKTPLGHIPPIYGYGKIIHTYKSLRSEFDVKYNGWKKIEDYGPDGVDNEEQAPPDGTPSWYTLNMRTRVAINSMVTISAGIENILDLHYRPFSSGVSAPGRNLIISIQGQF